MASWIDLPNEIRLSILEILLQEGSVAKFATISREWQSVIEQRNFARIKLTTSCLANFGSIIHRNRHLVSYIWLCVELEHYSSIDAYTVRSESLSYGDLTRVVRAIRKLLSTLKSWEPNGELVLDISVHSPSDSKYLLKYLTFKPDTHSKDLLSPGNASADLGDRAGHNWVIWSAMGKVTRPIVKTFEAIHVVPPAFDIKIAQKWEKRLWREMPSVPAVTGVLLRQQTRRQWFPSTLERIFACFPRLQEVFYEPWRRLGSHCQRAADHGYDDLFQSLVSQKIRKLVVFENFNPYYSRVISELMPPRVPSKTLSQTTAKVSLGLEKLSASFLVDASLFFVFCEPSWKWAKLTSLILTSRVLTPRARPTGIDSMLSSAAAAAMEMPQLQTMELWNGRAGLAALFKYQSRYAALTWRGTWDFTLRPPVIQAWEGVARKHGARGLVVHMELLDRSIDIGCHGDAIHHLRLSEPVVRPVSLQQIRTEHNVHHTWEEMRRMRGEPEESDSEESDSEESDSEESDSEETESSGTMTDGTMGEEMESEEMESAQPV